jgi:hypothetical protein
VFSCGKYNKNAFAQTLVLDKEKAIISDGLSSVAPPYAPKLQLFQNRLNLESFLLVNLLSLSCV